MYDIILAILLLFNFAGTICLAWLLLKVNKRPAENQVTAAPEEPKISAPTQQEADSKAANAERLYLEGIQSILSYDMNTMKQYLKGVEEE